MSQRIAVSLSILVAITTALVACSPKTSDSAESTPSPSLTATNTPIAPDGRLNGSPIPSPANPVPTVGPNFEATETAVGAEELERATEAVQQVLESIDPAQREFAESQPPEIRSLMLLSEIKSICRGEKDSQLKLAIESSLGCEFQSLDGNADDLLVNSHSFLKTANPHSVPLEIKDETVFDVINSVNSFRKALSGTTQVSNVDSSEQHVFFELSDGRIGALNAFNSADANIEWVLSLGFDGEGFSTGSEGFFYWFDRAGHSYEVEFYWMGANSPWLFYFLLPDVQLIDVITEVADE